MSSHARYSFRHGLGEVDAYARHPARANDRIGAGDEPCPAPIDGHEHDGLALGAEGVCIPDATHPSQPKDPASGGDSRERRMPFNAAHNALARHGTKSGAAVTLKQLCGPLKAREITSCTFMARSRAAPV
jgi:hypothetical protein